MIVALRTMDGGLLCADKREIVIGAGRAPVKSDAIIKLSSIEHRAVFATVGHFKYSEGGFGTRATFDAGTVLSWVLGQAGETEQLLIKAAADLERKHNRVLADLPDTSLPTLTQDREFFSVVVLYSVKNTVRAATIVAKSIDQRRARVEVNRDESWYTDHNPLIIAPYTTLKDGTRARIVEVIGDYDAAYRSTLEEVRSLHHGAVAAAAVGAARRLIVLTGLTLDGLYGQDLLKTPISPACDCAFVGKGGGIVFPYPSEKLQ